MLSFKFNIKDDVVNLKLPTSLTEITPEYLKSVTNQIQLADDYTLIAIAYRESFANVVMSGTKKGKLTAAVVPIFVKTGHTDNEYMNTINCGDKLVIGASDISMGFHATTPKNMITFNHVVDLFNDDKQAYLEAVKIRNYCYFVEFKIVPNCTIHGHYDADNDESFSSPFVHIEHNTNTQGVS